MEQDKRKCIIRPFVYWVIVFCIFFQTNYAQDAGDLDISFGNGGIVTTNISNNESNWSKVAIQLDGKIVLTGNILSAFTLVRYNTDGTMDGTFGSGGIVTTSLGTQTSGKSIAIQDDGKIVVAGWANSGASLYYNFSLVRYNADGTMDATFGTGGVVATSFGGISDYIEDMAIQMDGKIVVAGNYNTGVNDNWDIAVVRYNSDGSLDNTFDYDGKVSTDIFGMSEYPYSLAIQQDGKIIVAGNSDNGSKLIYTMVRYNNDGSIDNTFGTEGIVTKDFGTNYQESQKSITIQEDGKIVTVGHIVQASSYDYYIVRYNSDGSIDNTFSSDGFVSTAIGSYDDWGQSVAIMGNGKIIAGGFYQVNSTDWDWALICYNSDGSLDSTFSTDGIATVSLGDFSDWSHSMVIQADGKIVLAGATFNGTDYDFALARFIGYLPDNIVESGIDTGMIVYPNPVQKNLTVNITDESQPQILQLYDFKGEKIIEQKITMDKIIDIESLYPGIYFLKIGNHTQKIIKE